ncbi:phage terminase large subunit [Shouchella rhizosphaerae]|uniref:Phage terminase large subunit n=2 Tax=Shouchella rhizosphaerae TaxID=866786 RepID=A0ABZ2CZ52_9BACI
MLIAWLDGRWLNAKERAEYIATYTEYLDALDEAYPSTADMDEDTMLDYLEKAAELDRLERIHRCEGNLLEFAIEYFSDARNDGNDGNWDGFDVESVDEAPAFHRELTDLMNTVSNDEPNAKIAAAAPRSHAKSTYLSKAFPVHEVVYRRRRYAIIISETPAVSKANMEWIRNQLKFNAKLRADFGPLLSPSDQANIRDNSEAFIAWYPDGDHRKQVALVEATSTGQALRGRNWNGSRPDLIICDDLEDARPGGNASTPEQRAKLKDWFSQTVMPLGDPKGKRTAYVVMGTTVHMQSLLMHILYKRSDFKTKVYRAIIKEPRNMRLWDECRAIYIDRKNPNRLKEADEFYAVNEAAMLEGSEVLWPEVQPLLKLMKWKWDNGSKAFNTEYMNNPIDEESMVFNPNNFKYHNGNINWLKHDVALAVDFAMGKERGDYSAITTVALDKESGLIYVIDAFGERLKPDEFLKVIVDKVVKYQPTVIAAEAQAAQEFFVDELKKQLQAVGYPSDTRVKKIKHRSRKELRIEALLPSIENETIHFDRNHALLLEQFEQYGTGAHDDVIDALEMAVSAVHKANRKKAGTVGTLR